MTAKRAEGMSVTVTSFVRSHKHRELSDMDIKVLEESSGLVPRLSPVDEWGAHKTWEMCAPLVLRGKPGNEARNPLELLV